MDQQEARPVCLCDLAEASGVREASHAMFEGKRINWTEDRAVLHVALRNRSKAPVVVDGQERLKDLSAVQITEQEIR